MDCHSQEYSVLSQQPEQKDFSGFFLLLHSSLTQPFLEMSVLRWKLNQSKTPNKRSKSGFVQQAFICLFYSRPLLNPVQLLEQLPLKSNKNHGYNLSFFPELFRRLIDFFRVKYKHLSPAGLNSNTLVLINLFTQHMSCNLWQGSKKGVNGKYVHTTEHTLSVPFSINQANFQVTLSTMF